MIWIVYAPISFMSTGTIITPVSIGETNNINPLGYVECNIIIRPGHIRFAITHAHLHMRLLWLRCVIDNAPCTFRCATTFSLWFISYYLCIFIFLKPYHLFPAHCTSLSRCHLFVSFLSRFSVYTVFIRSTALCVKFEMEFLRRALMRNEAKKCCFHPSKLYLKPCSWTSKSRSPSPMRWVKITMDLTMFRSVIHHARGWNLMTRPDNNIISIYITFNTVNSIK